MATAIRQSVSRFASSQLEYSEISLMQQCGDNDLTTGLGAAGFGHLPTDTLLAALVELDPASVVRRLVSGDPFGARGEVDMRRALDALSRKLAAQPGVLTPAEITALLHHDGAALSPDAAAALVSRLEETGDEAVLDAALDRVIERWPEAVPVLWIAARRYVATGDGARGHDLLTRLGRCDPSLATMQQISRMRRELPALGRPPVRIAFLSSFTIDPLVPFVDLECRALGLDPETYVGPFNAWGQEVLAEGSGLHRFGAEIAFLAVAAEDLMPEMAACAPGAELERSGGAAVDRLLAVAEAFTSRSPGLLVVHGLYSVLPDPHGPAAGRERATWGEVFAGLNARLAAGLRSLPRAYMLDVADVLLHRPGGRIDDPKLRHLARMRFGEAALAELARAYARHIAPLKGLTRKCVVLDLDNTLWGGIVGEDGLDGIRLGETAPGSEYREFQAYLRSLTHRGILLAINSKNNEADALEVLRHHQAMVLREDSFSAMRINWDPKPQNIVSLAEELNLGLDALVFVDDSDKERAVMRQALPQVITPELPRDPARYREALEALPQLHTLTITAEDRTRTRQYHERKQREQLRVSAGNLEEYLRSLEIVTVVGRATERTLPRVHQLFQRTNQFNLTGRRYDLGALTGYASDSGWRLYTAAVLDRFGDHGLVAGALVRTTDAEWTVENFVMSCRVIGYGVEAALLAYIAKDARTAGVASMAGEFITTAKNAPARGFYASHQFERARATNGIERWHRSLRDDGIPSPAWITVREA